MNRLYILLNTSTNFSEALSQIMYLVKRVPHVYFGINDSPFEQELN